MMFWIGCVISSSFAGNSASTPSVLVLFVRPQLVNTVAFERTFITPLFHAALLHFYHYSSDLLCVVHVDSFCARCEWYLLLFSFVVFLLAGHFSRRVVPVWRL